MEKVGFQTKKKNINYDKLVTVKKDDIVLIDVPEKKTIERSTSNLEDILSKIDVMKEKIDKIEVISKNVEHIGAEINKKRINKGVGDEMEVEDVNQSDKQNDKQDGGKNEKNDNIKIEKIEDENINIDENKDESVKDIPKTIFQLIESIGQGEDIDKEVQAYLGLFKEYAEDLTKPIQTLATAVASELGYSTINHFFYKINTYDAEQRLKKLIRSVDNGESDLMSQMKKINVAMDALLEKNDNELNNVQYTKIKKEDNQKKDNSELEELKDAIKKNFGEKLEYDDFKDKDFLDAIKSISEKITDKQTNVRNEILRKDNEDLKKEKEILSKNNEDLNKKNKKLEEENRKLKNDKSSDTKLKEENKELTTKNEKLEFEKSGDDIIIKNVKKVIEEKLKIYSVNGFKFTSNNLTDSEKIKEMMKYLDKKISKLESNNDVLKKDAEYKKLYKEVEQLVLKYKNDNFKNFSTKIGFDQEEMFGMQSNLELYLIDLFAYIIKNTKYYETYYENVENLGKKITDGKYFVDFLEKDVYKNKKDFGSILGQFFEFLIEDRKKLEEKIYEWSDRFNECKNDKKFKKQKKDPRRFRIMALVNKYFLGKSKLKTDNFKTNVLGENNESKIDISMENDEFNIDMTEEKIIIPKDDEIKVFFKEVVKEVVKNQFYTDENLGEIYGILTTNIKNIKNPTIYSITDEVNSVIDEFETNIRNKNRVVLEDNVNADIPTNSDDEIVSSRYKKHKHFDYVIKTLNHPLCNVEKLHEKITKSLNVNESEPLLIGANKKKIPQVVFGSEESLMEYKKYMEQTKAQEKLNLSLLYELKKKMDLVSINKKILDPVFLKAIDKSTNDLSIIANVPLKILDVAQIMNEPLLKDYFSRYVAGMYITIYIEASDSGITNNEIPPPSHGNSFKLREQIKKMDKIQKTIFKNVSYASDGSLRLDSNTASSMWNSYEEITIKRKKNKK